MTRKRNDQQSLRIHNARAAEKSAEGQHDISIDGETLSVRDSEFDLLFKQLSNLKHTKDPSKDPRMTLQEDIVFIKDLVLVFLCRNDWWRIRHSLSTASSHWISWWNGDRTGRIWNCY